MGEDVKRKRSNIKEISFRVVGAILKAILIFVVYLLVSPFLTPVSTLFPGLMETLELFVIMYVVLMILGDIAKGTIVQYFFGTARSLFFIGYLLFSMGDGVLNSSFQNYSLSVNLTLFYTIAIMLSLLGFAKTIMEAINFMVKRAESKGLLQVQRNRSTIIQ